MTSLGRLAARLLVPAVVAAVATGSAAAHDNHKHAAPPASQTPSEAPSQPALPPITATPFPVQVDGRFSLIDQAGVARTEQDFEGRFTLIFFGYATCKGICSVALPRLAIAMDELTDLGESVQPILITVDPVRDTPEAMREILPSIHERLIGLTGSDADLAAARESFGVESELVFIDPTIGEVYRHGAFIYLMGPDGTLLSVLPPILAPERIAEIVRRHVAAG